MSILQRNVALVMPPQGFTVNAQTPLPLLVTQKVPLETVLRNLIHNAIKLSFADLVETKLNCLCAALPLSVNIDNEFSFASSLQQN